MRFKSLTLTNYIGIYNGCRKEEIHIDFTKCLNKKVIIRGANGSGKTTILSALSPLPDDNSCIISTKEGKKVVEIIDNGNIYSIIYIHPIKVNTLPTGEVTYTRQTIKGYLYKNGENLVPNGNISDCKDMIFSILNLDANFIALSQLTSGNRGLIDKKPSERKKFVNSIMNNLETYNAIYKTLTKKSSIFRSMINTLGKNISALGDKDMLESEQQSLFNQLRVFENQRDFNTKSITVSETNIARLDPNGLIQTKYNHLKQSIEESKRDIKPLQTNISKGLAVLGLSDVSEVLDAFEKDKKSKSDLELKSSLFESKINEIMGLRNSEVQNLDSKIERLASLNSEVTHKNINELISQYTNKLNEITELFNSIGVSNLDILTKDEYVIGLNTLKELKDVVDALRDNFMTNIIKDALDEAKVKATTDAMLNLKNRMNELIQQRVDLMSKISLSSSLIKTMEALEKRPADCSIDSCAFIKAALDAKKELDSIGDLQKDLMKLEEIISNAEKSIAYGDNILKCNASLTSVFRYIDSFGLILNKLPNGYIFSNRDEFIKRLLSHDSFDEIYSIIRYLDIANMIEQYHSYKKDLDTLISERKIYKSKFDLINQIQDDIDSLTVKVDKMSMDILSYRDEKSRLDATISSLSERASRFEILLSQIKEFNELNQNLLSQVSSLDTCEQEMKEISIHINNINTLTQSNEKIINSINICNNKLDNVKYSLKSLEEYRKELDIYLAKFNKVEKIKYYASPTSGISTLFIDMYMNKTIDMANTLLANLFEGEFKLLPFVINEDEFKIPCIGSGIPNDDVSSMSTGQVCMIGMIVSFAMLYQSSTRYNILRLDEIDGGLDTHNRIQCLAVLDKLMDILGCEQTIMISHNNEINLATCDIIQLRGVSDQDISDGNIIFSI